MNLVRVLAAIYAGIFLPIFVWMMILVLGWTLLASVVAAGLAVLGVFTLIYTLEGEL